MLKDKPNLLAEFDWVSVVHYIANAIEAGRLPKTSNEGGICAGGFYRVIPLL